MSPTAERAGDELRPDGLEQRRRAIHRGLKRSFYAVLAVSAMVGFLATVAVWLSHEARHQAQEAQAAKQQAEASERNARAVSTRLWEFSSTAAALQRKTRREGQRVEALKIIAEAARYQPSRHLRDEALSALVLPDIGPDLMSHEEGGFEFAAAYDAPFEHFILNNDRHRAIVRRAADGALLMDEEGLGPGTPFWQFSPDGRLAAIAFRGGQIGVWDWQHTNLLARLNSIDAEFAEPPFDFAPDGRCLWLLTTNQGLAYYDLPTRTLTPVLTTDHPPRFVRLSRSGQFAAIACAKDLEVWDLATRTKRATLTLTNDIWCVAWQPAEEALAIGCHGGLFLWDVGASQATTLRPDGAITVVFFTSDGGLLFTAGWNIPGEVWNIRARSIVLHLSTETPWLLSRDQTRLAFYQERVRFGIQQYLPPLGMREWPAPPSLGSPTASADVDPYERWLLTSHAGGWLIRDANSGKELARAQGGPALAVTFSADGSNVLAWTHFGLQRWLISGGERPGALAVGPPQMLWAAGERPLAIGCFAHWRRYAACCQDGLVTVLDLQNLSQPKQFGLKRPGDNSQYLSPDGRWLMTGHHNQHGIDWYDTQEGRFVRRFAEAGFAGPMFDPQTGALFTGTATNYTRWNLETGQPERSVPWPFAAAYQALVAFAPDRRQALVHATPSTFHLYDLQTARDFATLDLRDRQGVVRADWSQDGQRLFLFGNDGEVIRLELPVLRKELGKLGLDWSNDDPSREFPGVSGAAVAQPAAGKTVVGPAPASPGLARPDRLTVLVALALLLITLVGIYILRYQRRLFSRYLETEAHAARSAAGLKEAQTALLHSQKMKALGTMAAGVAHDFNNLLSVIRLSNELIEEQTQPAGVTLENFRAVQQAVQRGKGIVNSMLGYAREDDLPCVFPLAELISESVALLSKSFLGSLVLRVEVAPGTPPVLGRKGRIEQMLLNLIVNGSEAMQVGGTLTLAARLIDSSAVGVLEPRQAPPWVELSVRDTGPGIPPDVLPRVFEPFFTTKNSNGRHGTGLGLSMLYAMAREDGIGVSVETERGAGTVFRLLLPVAGTRQDDLPKSA